MYRKKLDSRERAREQRVVNPFIARPSPPPQETEQERQKRVMEQQDAQARSRKIDDFLAGEGKEASEQRNKAVRILLLGQAESGKSAVLKSELSDDLYTQADRERADGVEAHYTTEFNKVNIKVILDTLDPQNLSASATTTSIFTKHHQWLYLSLSPLRAVDTTLCSDSVNSPAYYTIPSSYHAHTGSREICVRAGSEWKATFNTESKQKHTSLSARSDPGQLLNASRDAMMTLWDDAGVKAVLKAEGVNVWDKGGFFLDDIDRVTRKNYVPTDADIVRARVRTIGIEEYRFVLEEGPEQGSEVYITDVGGQHSQRFRWAPYFDDAQTILFLAPLAFNQMLEEDPHINRLEDSLTLWREICTNKLLARANIIVFFNKKDVLEQTIARGVMVKKYVPSYGDLPNTVEDVTKYFKEKFRSYFTRLSPFPRKFLAYETTTVDTKATSVILISVHDTILREHLKRSDLI